MLRISESTVRRMSHYYRFLQEMEDEGQVTVSSQKLAERGNITPAKVRKDLSYFGSFGRRGLGYDVKELKEAIKGILGLDRRWNLLLIGAGNLGSALFSFREFRNAGFDIVAILERDAAKVGKKWGDVEIQDFGLLETVLAEKKIDMAVLAIPAKSALPVAEKLIQSGIKTILNFAPIKLPYREGVTIRDVNLTIELETLTFLLQNQTEVFEKSI